MKHSAISLLAMATLVVLGFSTIGCGPKPPNTNYDVETMVTRLNPGGTTEVDAPLSAQPVEGQWQYNNPNANLPITGTTTSFQGVTRTFNPSAGGVNLLGWPTTYNTYNLESPAYWNIEWSHPPYCHDKNPPYGPLPNPSITTWMLEPTISSTDPAIDLKCYINTPLTEGFVPANMSPQLVLDDALPATMQVTAFDPIQAAPGITNLHVFGTDLSNLANVSAISVASDGSSAVFPYPRQSNGLPLPAGAYITTITTDPSGSPQTTNGMEPFYIAHDDTSYTSAFGVAVASPTETDTYYFSTDQYGEGCLGYQLMYTDVFGGTTDPLVTSLTLGKLIGDTSGTAHPGSNPTVVIPFNDFPQSSEYYSTEGGSSACFYTTQEWKGAQSALVVNTGSASVSVVSIGTYSYPVGTISVGNHPVAAVISPSETMAYIANYDDGTISEVDLVGLIQTKTIRVMDHPASLAFDSNWNLWVGGQGSVVNVNVSGWFIASSTPVNGTVTGMSYDTQQGALVQTILQNGNSASVAAGGTIGEGTGEGATGSNPIVFNSTPRLSYSTQSTFSVATLASTTSTSSAVMGDNAAYAQSSIAPKLAFPGQTAFSPPIYSTNAINGDIIATVNGTSFTVSILATGQILMQGTLPYPARGVALTPAMVYFTMPESNSLVSLPIQLP